MTSQPLRLITNQIKIIKAEDEAADVAAKNRVIIAVIIKTRVNILLILTTPLIISINKKGILRVSAVILPRLTRTNTASLTSLK